MAQPQVALSTDFLKAFAAIPKAQQKKVRAFVEKFKADPTQASINYEPIHDMADAKVRTVRIDQAYRAIVIHPPQGDVYLCVWVDNHDEAMAWARNKHFDVNPHTGSLQVWQSQEGNPGQAVSAVAAVEAISSAPVPKGHLFAGSGDDDLLLLGVPEPLLPAVRALRVERDLDSLAHYLPEEARDGLYMLAAGYSVDEATEELATRSRAEETQVNVDDFSAALSRPGSARQFKLVEDDAELAQMLDAPLDQWRIFLHPSQRKLVSMHSSGSARVLGGAGTGKTVVAMHRARYLAQQMSPESGKRVLFTTFTKNLAANIESHLDRLCGPERERIDVLNLHALASRLLRTQGINPKVLDHERAQEYWDKATAYTSSAASFPQSFYEQEWDQIIQSQDITEEAEYLRARRMGRGTPLSRTQRREVWKVLAAYRDALDEAGLMEWDDVIREARLLVEKQPSLSPYANVVADEVQDFRLADLRLLRALAPPGPNDIFVVGDAHQRIYTRRGALSRAGISVRGRQSRTLRINYRTTESIRNWSVALLEGIAVDDLDEGIDLGKGYTSLRAGTAPNVRLYKNRTEESKAVVQQIRDWLAEGVPAHAIAVVASRDARVKEHMTTMKGAGIDVVQIKTEADTGRPEAVRAATMHRVKGLEFRCVLIACVEEGEVPVPLAGSKFPDEGARLDHLETQRRLLYVAATRARDQLVITGARKLSELISS